MARSPTAAQRHQDAEPQPSHADLRRDMDVHTMTLQRIERKVDDVGKTVGTVGTDEHGRLIGTGIAGDLGRLKEKVDRYEGWLKVATGFLAALTILGPIIWWLVQHRLEFLQ